MLWTILILTLVSRTLGGGIGTAWDISPGKKAEATTHPSWPRVNLSAFEVRSVSGVGHTQQGQSNPVKKTPENYQENRNAKELEDMENDYAPEILFDHPIFKGIFRDARKDIEVEMIPPGPWEKSRKRERKGRNRETCPESLEDDSSEEKTLEHPRVRRETEETQMEKISGTKNAREPRMNSPDSWSTQPLSVEFRHHTNLDSLPDDEEDDSRSISRAHQKAPHVDFVTASRRSFNEPRESRDLLPRPYEDMYRNNFNNLRDSRDLDLSYSRGYHYPDSIRTEREYLIRGLNEPSFSPERYRIEDFDIYRNRPTPKPKRIIYYATLPEVVRKPVDLRSYSRPYDNMGRASIPLMNRDSLYKKQPSGMDLRYRYRNYPYGGYDAYDPYMKRSSYYERPYTPSYDRLEEDRYREQDLDHASFKEAPRTDEKSRQLANSDNRSQEKSTWPVQVGTEVNIKDAERISGRKFFGNHQDFDRFRPNARVEQNSEEKPSGENAN